MQFYIYYNNKRKVIKAILAFLFLFLFILKLKGQGKKYKIVAISYANQKYKTQLEINKKTALEIGKVTEYYAFGPEDIDKSFQNKNKDILSRKRGNGYWLWKPYFILKTLKEKLKEGDYLIYSDAGILYINSTYNIINFLKKKNIDIWAYQLQYKEKIWTKRDAFLLLGVDHPNFTESYQYMAGIQIYRKSNLSQGFLEDVLHYSTDKRIITDEKNSLGFPNYKGFKQNRHDQTVLSLMIKKYGFKLTNIKTPFTFCIYRRLKFKDYNDLKNKCKKIK